MEKVVVTKNLRHAYGTREALKGVSFEIEEGKIFGLLGPNGSGKTTLFRILSTALLPSGGEAWIQGINLIEKPDEVRRKIGVVFQSPSLDMRLTVRENLLHQGYLYGLSGSALRKRADEMLSHLGLLDRAKELAGGLSGGLKRRAELAKGLLHKPSLVILDEPSTGLDPGARMDLWRYLEALRKESKISILVTTHLMEEAEHCDVISIMNEGLMIRSGAPSELKSDVGGDVLEVESRDPKLLQDQIAEKLKTQSRVLEGRILIEHSEGSRFITKLIETFPGLVQSVTFRKPTLEDVFVHHTGHQFWNSKAEHDLPAPKKNGAGHA